jgi:hypothetical protein
MSDSTRLAALVAVAEAGSITRAAARLGYTRPRSPSSWPSWSGRQAHALSPEHSLDLIAAIDRDG